ncbi:trans-aconitate 2-methyltransferase [Streptacidiphilus sp. N1-12]|uniref:Trans-aconitate 2-methyltransferase n=2 Tax=Streptacidiphilus alkalitolerans TaxID=3342712 RepID=A0ABV6WMG5_9ACTN
MAHQPHHHHHCTSETDHAPLAELLDLDAEVLHKHLANLVGWVDELTGGTAPRRILDLGCGTGTGTFALLQHFERAEAVAVDGDPQMLRHLSGKARALGLADRISTVQADLDADWPAVGTVDLVWASASLHHMADPDRTLREVFAALRPGGLLLAIEIDSFPRFLPDDLGFGRPGLEARAHAAMDARRAVDMPHLGSDWGPRLTRNGFTVEAERRFAIDLKPPLPASAGRYAQASLQRIRGGFDGELAADDLAALDTLLSSESPAGLLHRDDLTVRAARTAWAARRPE